MIKKLVLRNSLSLLAFLLAIQTACVIPGLQISNENLPTKKPTEEIFSNNKTLLPEFITKDNPNACLDYPAPILFYGEVDVLEGLHLRNSPNSNAEVTYVLSDGDILEVFNDFKSEDGGLWYAIRYNDFCGYVNSKYVLSLEKPSGE